MTGSPKIHRRHGFYVLVMVIGWVLPPIAVLLRFGFGTDFLLNILLTLYGYIPGHGHNFYLQNIRNNENRKRTPKWATRAGLVKDKSAKRKAQTQWANRYDERTPTRADGYQDDDTLPTSQDDRPRPSSLDPHVTDQSSIPDRINRDPSRPLTTSSSTSLEARDLDRDSSRPTRRKLARTSSNERISSRHSMGPSPTTKKISRRKTGQSFQNYYERSHRSEEDQSFVRRPSSVSGSLSYINKPQRADYYDDSIKSPTSTKSFSQFLGIRSKKSVQKNRFDLSNEARDQWSKLPSRNSAHSLHRPPRDSSIQDDGLNHQF